MAAAPCLAALLLALPAVVGPAAAQSSGSVILWNTLDSVDEVENSRVGPNGGVIGARFAFEPGAFGNGYVRKATGANYVRFSADIFNQVRERGTVGVGSIRRCSGLSRTTMERSTSSMAPIRPMAASA